MSHLNFLQKEKVDGGIKGITHPAWQTPIKPLLTITTYSTANGPMTEGNLSASGEMIAYRGLFLINKEGVVMHQVVNFFTLVRSVSEVLRMVETLQTFEIKEKSASWIKRNFRLLYFFCIWCEPTPNFWVIK